MENPVVLQRPTVVAQRSLRLGELAVDTVTMHRVAVPDRERQSAPEGRNRFGMLFPVVEVGAVAQVGEDTGRDHAVVYVAERHAIVFFGSCIVALRMEDIGVETVYFGVVAVFVGLVEGHLQIFERTILLPELVVHVGADHRPAESQVVETPFAAAAIDLLGVLQSGRIVAHAIDVGQVALRGEILPHARLAACVIHRPKEVGDAAAVVHPYADGVDAQRIADAGQGHRVVDALRAFERTGQVVPRGIDAA